MPYKFLSVEHLTAIYGDFEYEVKTLIPPI